MNKLSTLDWIALILVIVGGINWGLAPFGINLVESLGNEMVVNIVYYLVGLAAIYLLISTPKLARK